MPRHRPAKLLRRATIGAALLLSGAGCLASPASAWIASSPNSCLYSYDQEWREIDVAVDGTTTATRPDGTPVAAGTALDPGDKVVLSGAKLEANLPQWIAKFGADGGWLHDGDQFAIDGWITLTATNTVEGTTAAIPFQGSARVDLAYQSNGEVDEAASTVTIDPIGLPTQTWTAAGGTVNVSQGLGDTLGPLPVGRNGSLTTPEGSLAVKATFDTGFDQLVLTLECLPGTTGGAGLGGLVEAVPPLIGPAWNAPGYTGALSPSAPFAEPVVRADIARVSGPIRAAVGAEAVVAGNLLRVPLTDAQRDAWLGTDPVDHAVGGSLILSASNATPATQSVVLTGTLVDGSNVLGLPLPTTRWTRTAEQTAAIAPTGPITLTSPGRPDLVLTPRASGPGSFATVQRSRTIAKDPGNGGGTGTDPVDTPRPSTTNPPSLGPATDFRPPPAVVAKPKVVTINTTRLKVGKNAVKLKLTNPRAMPAKVRLTLRTAAKAKVRGKRKIVTVVPAATTTVKAGRSVTLTLKLSADARILLKQTAKVGVSLTVVPVGSTTTQAVSKALTLRR